MVEGKGGDEAEKTQARKMGGDPESHSFLFFFIVNINIQTYKKSCKNTSRNYLIPSLPN